MNREHVSQGTRNLSTFFIEKRTKRTTKKTVEAKTIPPGRSYETLLFNLENSFFLYEQTSREIQTKQLSRDTYLPILKRKHFK